MTDPGDQRRTLRPRGRSTLTGLLEATPHSGRTASYHQRSVDVSDFICSRTVELVTVRSNLDSLGKPLRADPDARWIEQEGFGYGTISLIAKERPDTVAGTPLRYGEARSCLCESPTFCESQHRGKVPQYCPVCTVADRDLDPPSSLQPLPM